MGGVWLEAWLIAAVWWFAFHSLGFAVAVIIAGLPVACAVAVDRTQRRLPHGLSLTVGVVGIVYAATGLLDGRVGSMWGAALGGLLAGVSLMSVHLVTPRGLGWGDVKFAAALGVFAGAAHPFYALGIPLSASLFAIALSVRRVGLRRRAFGPYLAAGAALSLIVGPWWVSEVGGRVLWR